MPIIPAQPVRWSARPLTLPSGTVALGAWAFYPQVTEQQPQSLGRATDDSSRFSAAGYAVGIRGAASDDVELEAVETFTLGYLPGDVLLGLKVRLLSGDLELALGGAGRIPAYRAEVGGGYLSLSGLGRIADELRIDASLGLAAVKGLERALGGKACVGLFQPADVALGEWLPMRPGLALGATLNPVAYVHVAIETGFGIQDFTEPSSSFVPLGFRIGGAIPSDDAPLIDIDLNFVVPYFLMPVKGEERWPPHAERVVVADSWWVTLGLWGYIYT